MAFHEAGHSVLSAAINAALLLVGILDNGVSLGPTRYPIKGKPVSLIQVHLRGGLEHGLRSLHSAIRERIEFYYCIAKASLVSKWPTASAVARALLQQDELDTDSLLAVTKGLDLRAAALSVQRFHATT